MAWYKNGRVTINTGDTYLTGINTRFASNTRVGDAIRAPDGEWYELVNTSSETVLGIYPPYRGPSVADSSDYMIAPIQGYNKETADRLRFITDNIRDFSEDVTAARLSAEAAKASEDAARDSATAAQASEDKVTADANMARDSAAAALVSENNASQSQQAASISETNAKKSETNSSLSETNSANSATASADSAEAARLSAEAAAQSEYNAALSETNAKTSETNAKTSETNANEDASTANTDAATSTQARLDALEALRLAEKARDDAIAAANANTGQVQDLGMIDLSSGVYPARPVVSSFWYVDVGGTVTESGETIVYGKGDVLRFSKPLERFYKVDNTDAVTSVAGKTGVVDLDKVDVGLDRVDNTNDLEKPVSNAVQAELDIRQPMADPLDTTPGRVVVVGGFGENGGTPIYQTETDDANNLIVRGTYIFSNGGVNLPTASAYYVQHVVAQATGYAKQFAYSVSTNSNPYVRTQVGGVWSEWRTYTDIVDGLTSTREDAALSANAGRLLQEQLQANNATIVQYTYKLNAGQLVISGNDLTGKNLSYVPGSAVIVSLNGFQLLKDTDFTATTGESISLSQAIEDSSDVLITVFGAFSIANHYTKSESDALLSNLAAQSAEALLTVRWVPSRNIIAPGTFPMDGGLYSRTTYPDAWALIRDGKVPKVTDAAWLATSTNRASFTEGDGSTNFRVPDYNGKSAGSTSALFQRGDGLNAGASGIIQLDALQDHQHTIPLNGQGVTNGYVSYKITANTKESDGATSNALGARVSVETRSINVAGVWTIRLFGSTTNLANLDVAQIAANLSTLDNAAYKKSNIVGVVSQTSGIPTGAIIERNSNSNGDYTKYADGTLVCTFKYDASSMAVTSPIGSLFQAGQEATWTYPHAFAGVPVPQLCAGRNDGAVILGTMVRSVSNTTLLWRLWSATSFASGNVKDVYLTANGRWF